MGVTCVKIELRTPNKARAGFPAVQDERFPGLGPGAGQLFKDLDFHTFLKNPLFANNKTLHYTVKVLATVEEVRDLAHKIAEKGFVSIDTETTSTVARQALLVGISLAVDTDSAYYIPVGHEIASGPDNAPFGETLTALKHVIESPAVLKIGQNLKYDYQVFKNQEDIIRKNHPYFTLSFFIFFCSFLC